MPAPKRTVTTTPIAATATSSATRATALFTPDAVPALRSSTPASTAAVRGATVIDNPIEKTSRAGRSSVR